MDIETVSSSSYSTYDFCAWKWFLRYVLGFDDPSGPSAVLGQYVHETLDHISDLAINKGLHSVPDADEDTHYSKLIEFYKNKFREQDPETFSRINKTDMRKVEKSTEELCLGRYSPYSSKTISSEARFKINATKQFGIDGQRDGKKTDLLLLGKIDRVDEVSADTIEIIDYKTGKQTKSLLDQSVKTYEDMFRDIQLGMYYVAARKLYPQYENILVTLAYIKTMDFFTLPFEKSNEKAVISQVRDKVHEIIQDSDPSKNTGWWCRKMCTFGKNFTCGNVSDEVKEYGYEFVQNKYEVINGRAEKRRKYQEDAPKNE